MYSFCKKVFVLAVILCLITGAAHGQDGFISAKDFAETQGIAYQWFPIQKMLVMRKGLKSVKLTVNSTNANVDGRDIQLPAAPQIKQGQIMVPAAAIIKLFQGDLDSLPESVENRNLNTAPPVVRPAVAPTNIPVTTPQPPPAQPALNTPQTSSEAVLVALRHSTRDDHTRIVLEFNENVTYSSELKGDNYRLNIQGCRNLVPTRRTNPVGRDIKKLDINSGPNRSGLILNFQVSQSKRAPEIETVANPFRMIVSFFADTEAQPASATPPIVQPEPAKEQPVNEPVKIVAQEQPPEINIEIPLEQLTNESFKGRTVVIDAGHGGSDTGFVFPGRIPEKSITLSIAGFLQQSLQKVGLKAVSIRNTDTEMTQSERTSIANRYGADLIISLHVGASYSPDKTGVCCLVYSKSGTAVADATEILSEAAVYREWLENTRFDLASFLARRINERLKTQLKVESRGVKQLPVSQLKYLINPAVLVEVGMLSDQTDGKNLLSSKYHEAVAAAITNGVVDFFNGIVIKP